MPESMHYTAHSLKSFTDQTYGPFQSHQDLISSDNIHPTDAGFGAYRQQWANTVLTKIYA
jgi:hypothetical protein